MKTVQTIIKNCKQAQLLGIKKQEIGISFTENMQLKLHIATCSVCKKILQQSGAIDNAVKNLLQQNKEPFTLTHQQKKQMQTMVNNEV